jgi:hypothetical protein
MSKKLFQVLPSPKAHKKFDESQLAGPGAGTSEAGTPQKHPGPMNIQEGEQNGKNGPQLQSLGPGQSLDTQNLCFLLRKKGEWEVREKPLISVKYLFRK